MKRDKRPPPLDEATRVRLAKFVRRVGERHAIELLDTNRLTLTRALSGLGVRASTAVVLRMRLDAIDDATTGGRSC